MPKKTSEQQRSIRFDSPEPLKFLRLLEFSREGRSCDEDTDFGSQLHIHHLSRPFPIVSHQHAILPLMWPWGVYMPSMVMGMVRSVSILASSGVMHLRDTKACASSLETCSLQPSNMQPRDHIHTII